MEVTDKDRETMIELLEKGLHSILEEKTPPSELNHYVFPIGIYLGCSKSMALEIYNHYKPLKVYFANSDGLWLLDKKGDISLCKE